MILRNLRMDFILYICDIMCNGALYDLSTCYSLFVFFLCEGSILITLLLGRIERSD